MMICLVRVLYAELWGNKRPMLKCKDCPCKCKERSEQMYCKLITKNDCAVNAVLSCTPVEFLIINKAIARCSNDEFYTESDRRTMVLMGEAMENFEQVEVADTPQTDCSWK